MRQQQYVAAQVQTYAQGLSVIRTVQMEQLAFQHADQIHQGQIHEDQIHLEQALAEHRQGQIRRQGWDQLDQIHLVQIQHQKHRRALRRD